MTDTTSTKRTLSALWNSLEKDGKDVEKIKENITTTCSRTMQILAPLIEHKVKVANGNLPVPGQPF
jgi:ribosomal protein S19